VLFFKPKNKIHVNFANVLLVAFSIPSGLLSCFPDYRIALPNNIPVLITEINFNQPTGVTLFCVDFLVVTNFSLQLKTGKKNVTSSTTIHSKNPMRCPLLACRLHLPVDYRLRRVFNCALGPCSGGGGGGGILDASSRSTSLAPVVRKFG
jgi:hypothetical protein